MKKQGHLQHMFYQSSYEILNVLSELQLLSSFWGFFFLNIIMTDVRL